MAYWLIWLVSRGIFRAFFRIKVEGRENIPLKSNFIIVANHTSYLDPLIVQSSVRKKIHCLIHQNLLASLGLRIFLRLEETIPVGGISNKAIENLHGDRNIGLFPEGKISVTGRLLEFRRGAALLAYKTGRPVVPCAIIGACAALPYGSRWPKFLPLKLKIGKPLYLLKEFDEVIDDVKLQEGTFRIRNAIKEMLDAG